MTVHVVMPARPSHVPNTIVRRCTACPWVRHKPRDQRDELDRLAAEHIADPDAAEES